MAKGVSGSGINTLPMATLVGDMGRLQQRLPPALADQDVAQAGRIAGLARDKGTGLGSVHSKAAPGIKAINQRPIIRLFVDEHPYILGAEFGGGRRPTTRQFPSWRGKGEGAGYMLYPTIREDTEDDGSQFYDDYADTVANNAGFS
jgi:hypothetical protein